MEDRYLFRGKCIDDGEWMSGSYYELAGRPLIFKPVFASKKAVYEIDPSTICQCTGLNDKSGRRIFENDILSGISTLSFQKMRRESVSCGMKTDGVRMSRAVITTRNWMILIQRILK